MLSKRPFLCYLLIIIVVVVFGENRNCVPNKLILLSNCSFRHSQLTTRENRTLSMIVPYPVNPNDEEKLLITILTPKKSFKPLIRFNLNIIQCSEKNSLLNWTSLESSSTLHGEFVRTSHIEQSIMYLPPGKTYLKNLTSVDCVTKTLYRTDDEQLFQLDLTTESTLKDYCTNDQSCSPREIYQCNQGKNRCHCRKPFQVYSIDEQYPICLQAVQTIDQCATKPMRCLEWCRQNSSSSLCLCPAEYSTKKLSSDNRAYCESLAGGICNSLIQCPFNAICIRGTCQSRTHHPTSLDIVTISIIVSCLVLFLISILLVISIYILRRQRWKKHHDREEPITAPAISDYDNVAYDAFRKNLRLSSRDEHSYEPKVVYLGGEEQLTAIFA